MLELIGLEKRLGRGTQLHEISLRVPVGTTTAVLGPSGSGKTTLLRLVMGLETLDGGELRFEKRVLAQDGRTLVPAEKRGMSLAFQDFTLLPHLNVRDNIGFVLRQRAQSRRIINQLIDMFELQTVVDRKIDKLSGGEQQRVALARALGMRPRVLLLDEPFSNVDPGLREQLQHRLKEWLVQGQVTALLATHDQREAFLLSQRIAVLRQGRIIEQGTPQSLYATPRDAWVAEFLGHANILHGEQWAKAGIMRGLDRSQAYMVRPEAIRLVSAAEGSATGRVESAHFAGFYQDVVVDLHQGLKLKVRDLSLVPLMQGSRVGLQLTQGSLPHPVGTDHGHRLPDQESRS